MCSDTMRTANTKCEFPYCRRPVWRDPDGSYSSYCGKAHRDAMAKVQVTAPRGGLCQNCNTRPVYVEGNTTHTFCGIRCARASQTDQPSSSVPDKSVSPTNPSQVCRLAGCQRPVFVDRTGIAGQFCSNEHRREAVTSGKAEACLECRVWPKEIIGDKESDFCSKRCSNIAISQSPKLFSIPSTYKAYDNVSKQFMNQWLHTPTAVPTIYRIWRIYGRKDLNNKYSTYKLEVERRTNIHGANVKRRFHGTKRACKLGDSDSSGQLCNDSSCSLCSIVRTSFQLARAQSNIQFGRFGKGIYTTATSSKANDYVQNGGGSPYKAMLLNQVVMGKAIKLVQDNTTLVAPPPGYDSVVGEPMQGGALNYDEAIVYNNDAIRPQFLIIYW